MCRTISVYTALFPTDSAKQEFGDKEDGLIQLTEAEIHAADVIIPLCVFPKILLL